MSSPLYEKDSEKVMNYLIWKGERTLDKVTNTTLVGLFRSGDKQGMKLELLD
jgi:hypothetical protein